jgi:hypothetical protein
MEVDTLENGKIVCYTERELLHGMEINTLEN